MKTARSFLVPTLLMGSLVAAGAALASDADGGSKTEKPLIIAKVESASGNDYCHMKFPAIRENTLERDRPALKDARSGDIVDYYGPCDHNPAGKDELEAQRRTAIRQRFPTG